MAWALTMARMLPPSIYSGIDGLTKYGSSLGRWSKLYPNWCIEVVCWRCPDGRCLHGLRYGAFFTPALLMPSAKEVNRPKTKVHGYELTTGIICSSNTSLFYRSICLFDRDTA